MKRILPIMLALIMAVSVLALTACGGGGSSSGGDADLSDSKYVGTWKGIEMTYDGKTEPLDEEWVVTINGDGTGTYDGDEGAVNFTWQPTDNGFKTSGDTKLTFTDDGDNIRCKMPIGEIIFVKE